MKHSASDLGSDIAFFRGADTILIYPAGLHLVELDEDVDDVIEAPGGDPEVMDAVVPVAMLQTDTVRGLGVGGL